MVGGQLGAAQHHETSHHRLQVAVRKVKPVEEARVVRMLGAELEPTRAVPHYDVFDDRGRLGQQQIAVLEQRRPAQRMLRAKFRR